MNRGVKFLLGAAVVSAIGALTIVPEVPTVTSQDSAVALEVSVEPTPLRISCPGSFVEFGGESGVDLGSIERVGEAAVSVAQAEYQPSDPLTADFIELVAEGDDQSTALLSASQAQFVDRERATGLSATFCEQPATTGWFISGQSSVGAETVLLLQNPNAIDTQLVLNLHLPGGITQERLTLGAGQERLIGMAPLAGLAPIYAIEFESLGTPIVAAIQQRFSRGLTPLGVSTSMASASVTTDQWMTPVAVMAEGYQAPVLRIYAPQERAEVIVTAFSAEGSEIIRQVVAEQSFVELPLELPNGLYALKLQSDQPVLAGVLNPSLEPLDHAWIAPAEALAEVTLAIPSYATDLVITNPNAVAISANVELLQGQRRSIQSVQVEPLSVVAVPVTGRSVSVSSASAIFTALQIRDPLGYAVIIPSENQNAGSQMEIIVR